MTDGALEALKTLVSMTVVTSAAEKKKRDDLVRIITSQILDNKMRKDFIYERRKSFDRSK